MNPLLLAVVGHTNTGKTSLMRTLLRDSTFGEVKNAAATTRHVEEAQINDTVRLYDTPGLEDAGGVLDWLEDHTSNQQDGIDRVQHFLASEAAQNEFSQEAKVLRQLIASDTALYVIDAREPVLPKYKDELTVLSWCAKPVMPIFNFTHNRDLSEWQTMLSRRNLHVYSSFDTVAFDFQGEIRLWNNLATMLPENQVQSSLKTLIATRQNDWHNLESQAKRHIARFLIEVAAYAQVCTDPSQREALQTTIQTQVRQHEHNLHRQLLSLYHFYQNEAQSSDWALQAFSRDPFDSDLLKEYGIRTSTGAAAGALIGLGLDALTLGTSLGLGATIGGIIGGFASNWQTLSNKINGVETLHIDEQTLAVLAARSLNLLAILQTRGHAANSEIILNSVQNPWQTQPESLRKARNYPKWSPLNSSENNRLQPEKEKEIEILANSFQAAIG
ncbi:GTPase/DUF3482 domain-containing protein [Kingella negevensis]|uniref:GTPase/DUF3482 domain-containing protein n=1 Tax=Kingella negevensis TaxID=1522312 RepID=UPI0025435F2A|nr:GTPase/DUF3482 domain-containing protein [Kingella negevensis]WII92724.1 GTPase/DUF3482 domain-containing protein [Kingella negevensis]